MFGGCASKVQGEGWNSSVTIVTMLSAGGFRVWNYGGRKGGYFLENFQSGSGTYTAFNSMGPQVLSVEWSGRGAKLNIHFQG